MPVIEQYIKSLVDIPIVRDEEPDEGVALGVGIAAAIKQRDGGVKDLVLADICPFSLGTALYDGTFSPIIERNDTLPCSRTRYYVTVNDYQTELTFPIYQGENLVAEDNHLLGVLKIKDLPRMPKGQAGASVTFLYDINGILDIKIVSDQQSVHKVMVNKKMGLTETALEHRLNELKQMTLHAAEKEENRLLIEKAKRLYQESSILVREYIAEQLRHFTQTLNFGSDREIREEYIRFTMYLEAIEQNKFDIGEFTEEFWKENDREEE